MAVAANPETGPAGAMSADDIVAFLEKDVTASPDTAAEPEAQQPPEAEATSEPLAGEDQAEGADPDPPTDDPPEPTVRVKVRGEWREIPVSEAANGYSRTEDYKAKTAELAREREALAAEKAAFTARAQRLDAVLAQAHEDPVLVEGQKTDWLKLAQEEPAEFVARRAAYDDRLAKYREAQAFREEAQQQAFQQQWQQTEAEMARDFAEWKTPEGRAAAKAGIVSVLREQGFSDAEIGSLADPRAIKLAHLAATAKATATARQTAETKRAPASPTRVLRPGTGNTGAQSSDAKALLNRASSARRIDDKADALVAYLEKSQWPS